MPVGQRVDGVAQVAQQMPAIRDLDGIRGALARTVGIGAGPIARDHLYTGVLAQPGGQSLGLAVWQEVNDGVALQVDQRRAVVVAAAPGPVVNAQHTRGWRHRGTAAA